MTLIPTIAIAAPPIKFQAGTFTGEVIAIHWAQFAMNGVVSPCILVKLDGQKGNSHEIIQIHGSVPEGKFAAWRTSLSAMKSFRVLLSTSSSFVLKQYAPVVNIDKDAAGSKPEVFPIWFQLNGQPAANLPFENSIRDFQSLEWPSVPVL